MGVAGAAQYQAAIRRLFPQGAYWNAQFADAGSDVSLFAEAKLGELVRFRKRMGDLQGESVLESADETIADWERVYLGYADNGLDLAKRKAQVKSRRDVRLNKTELQKTAAVFGLDIKEAGIPYRPGFFGFARFAQYRIGGFTAFSVVKITATEAGFEAKGWYAVKTEMERGGFARMRFGHGRLAYYPVYKRREIVSRALRRGGFGYGRFGRDTPVPFPVEEARRLAGARADTMRVTRLFFGQSRLPLFDGRFNPALVLDHDFLGGYVENILREAQFNRRFELVLLAEYVLRARPYKEFEKAASEKLLAGQTAIFHYEGE
jgi:hypothetical protein